MPFDNSPVTSPVIEALREGRARVERGWCQAVLHAPGGASCALGALCKPAPGQDTMEPTRAHGWGAIACLEAALGVQYSFDVAGWNDSPERTQADVLALYDRAIELAVEEALANG